MRALNNFASVIIWPCVRAWAKSKDLRDATWFVAIQSITELKVTLGRSRYSCGLQEWRDFVLNERREESAARVAEKRLRVTRANAQRHVTALETTMEVQTRIRQAAACAAKSEAEVVRTLADAYASLMMAEANDRMDDTKVMLRTAICQLQAGNLGVPPSRETLESSKRDGSSPSNKGADQPTV